MSVTVKDITMDFPGSRALDGVTASFGFDEVHGLIGENGAGKSTLVNILGGSLSPTRGQVRIDDTPVMMASPRDALAKGIAHVSQEGSLVGELTGADNILLGAEPRTVGGMIRHRELARRAGDLAQRWFPDVRIDLSRPVASLDVADRKVIEIVRALRGDIRLLILDEPTATLPSREKQRLWQIIRNLPEKGVGVVLISHFLTEVKALSERITVLRDGRHVGTLAAIDTTESGLIDLMLRRSGGSDTSGRRKMRELPEDATTLIEVTGWRAGAVHVPRFSVRSGEIVALIGLTGAGHFGFARSLYTRDGVVDGSIAIGGKPVAEQGPRAMQRHGIAFIPDNRMENALMADSSILENMSVVHPRQAARMGGLVLSAKAERAETNRVSSLLNVSATGPHQSVKTLSGGNKQKVSLGKWLYGAADRYKVMILIEPTEGVDIGAKQEIYNHIRDLADRGVGIVIASSDLLEVEFIADRVVPFVAGRAGADIARKAFSEARFIAAMAGEAA